MGDTLSYPQYPQQTDAQMQHGGEPPLWAPYYGAPFPAAVKRFTTLEFQSKDVWLANRAWSWMNTRTTLSAGPANFLKVETDTAAVASIGY